MAEDWYVIHPNLRKHGREIMKRLSWRQRRRIRAATRQLSKALGCERRRPLAGTIFLVTGIIETPLAIWGLFLFPWGLSVMFVLVTALLLWYGIWGWKH